MREHGDASNRSDRSATAKCLLNDPEHPDHVLYLPLYLQLGECLNGAGHPKWGTGQRSRVAAAMVVSARAAGLERVDQLELSEDLRTGTLIYKPHADNNLFNVSVQITLAEALRTSLTLSSDRWLQTITRQMRELWVQQDMQPSALAIGPRR